MGTGQLRFGCKTLLYFARFEKMSKMNGYGVASEEFCRMNRQKNFLGNFEFWKF